MAAGSRGKRRLGRRPCYYRTRIAHVDRLSEDKGVGWQRFSVVKVILEDNGDLLIAYIESKDYPIFVFPLAYCTGGRSLP